MSDILIIIIGMIIIAAIILFWLRLNKSTSTSDKEEIDGLIKREMHW